MQRCYSCFESIKDDLEVCPFCGYIEGTPPEEAVHMEPGTILTERYVIGRVLGYGGFGVTYIGWDKKLEQRVAIKEYLPSEFSTRMPGQSRVSIFSGSKKDQFESGLGKFIEEAKRLSKFQNEDGIVKVFDCIEDNDTAYIVMEYLEGETLAERLKRDKTIPEKEAVDLLMPVMRSLEVVHQAGIIHRDIAPDNVFITNDGQVKLIDFGAARFATTSHSRSLTVIIKPGYSAEEQYRSKSDQGPHTDVYSIAATLYKAITGETPPDALERRVKIENAKKDILTEPHKIQKGISLVTENAILNALNIQIEDRTQSIEQFIKDLTSEEPVKRVYGKIKKIDLYRMPLWLKILVPSLLAVFLIFGGLIAAGVIRINNLFKTSVAIPEGYTQVPNIEGMGIDEATKELATSKLNYTTSGSVTSDYVEANLIVYQNPESGKLLPINSLVEITVCRGNGEVAEAENGISTVPFFIWSEEQTAIQDFETAGLTTQIEYIYDENVAAGQVIKATDESGNEITAGMELPEGTKVILYVSMGPQGFAMPNVTGMTEAQAKSTLEQAGLVVSVTYVQTTTVAEGTVISQSIAADTNVTLGTTVSISVATASIPAANDTPLTGGEVPVVTNPTNANGSTANTTSDKSAVTSSTNASTGTNATATSTSATTGTSATNATASTDSSTTASTTTGSKTEYTITFDSDGGSSVSSIKCKDGDPIGTLPTPTKDYYYFDGWTSNGTTVNSSTVVTSDMTLKAQWTLKDEWSDWSEWSTTKVSEETNENGLVIVQVESVYHDSEYTPQYFLCTYECSDGKKYADPDWTAGLAPKFYSQIVDSISDYTIIGENSSGMSVYEDTNGDTWYLATYWQMSISPYYEYRYRTRIP